MCQFIWRLTCADIEQARTKLLHSTRETSQSLQALRAFLTCNTSNSVGGRPHCLSPAPSWLLQQWLLRRLTSWLLLLLAHPPQHHVQHLAALLAAPAQAAPQSREERSQADTYDGNLTNDFFHHQYIRVRMYMLFSNLPVLANVNMDCSCICSM